ncbi:MAG: T9SS type A sorting domain-containing protein, partial [Flavobacteriales bacterium]
PNPASKSTFIDLNGIQKNVSVDIYSLSGKLIKQINFHNTDHIEITLNDIPTGMYSLRIIADSSIFNRKLIVK